MPEVAANALEAVLSDWPIPENTPFRCGDTIATVETEKAVIDVPADADGVILKTLVRAGAVVGVGAPISLLGEPGEQVGDLDALLSQLGVRSKAAPSTPPRSTPTPSAGEKANGSARVFSSPLARRLAKEAGLSITDIDGTGPGARIVRRDVERAALAVSGRNWSARPGAAAAYDEIPHTRMRRAIAARLTESTLQAPHFFLRGTARVENLVKLRAHLNQPAAGVHNGPGTVRVSVNDLVVMAAGRAHILVPAMNVLWTPDAVRSFSGVDIALAVATDRGLLTPVLRNVGQMTPSAVAEATSDLVARARSGQLQQDELEGGTLTVTNLGMFGTESFAAIINPPQAAILAVGAALKKPVVVKGKLKVGKVMSFTLSVDHRPIEGATAAQWMATFISLIEEPVRILL